MALLSYTITLGAVAAPPTLSPATLFVSQLRIENEAGNATVKFGGSDLSGTVYGGSVAASDAVTLGPLVGAAIAVHDLYLLGTAGQKVHLSVITP
jgi:hypothetical protein